MPDRDVFLQPWDLRGCILTAMYSGMPQGKHAQCPQLYIYSSVVGH